MEGLGNADSWTTDAHKTLNVPYDSGVAIVADPVAMRSAFGVHTSYLPTETAGPGNPYEKVPELSRRARGVPVWATLIALVDAGTPVVGLVAAPALHRRWWAAQGTGAWTGRSLTSATSISVSKVDRLADASLSYSSFNGWAERGKDMDLFRLSKECWRSRAYGDFFSHMLVAQGSVDIAPEPELEDYDMAALVPIVTEAGGRFTGLDGAPGPFSGNAVASNGLLHDQALELIGD